MWEVTPVRFQADASAGTKTDLLAALEAQAKAFFGDEEYRLERDIDVEAQSLVTIAGKVEVTRYEGRAYYVNWRAQV